MITNAGGGYSRWKDLAVTRWREDSTCDNWGTFCYLRDVTSGEFWSTAYQPTLKRSENYEAIFSEGRAEFRRRDHDFDTHTEIAVSPEDDIELRRITITNRSRTRRDDRRHELRGSGPRAACRGRAASGVQQSLCSDRDHPPAAGDPLHSPAPLPRRAGALDVSPDGRARGGDRRDFLRDRPHAVHRPRQHRRRSASDARSSGALGQRGLSARSDCRHPVSDQRSIRKNR